MTDSDRPEWTDDALDRALEEALYVDPSPGFTARVRLRVASEPTRRSSGWWQWGRRPLIVLSGAAALVLAISAVWPGGAEPPGTAGAPQLRSGGGPAAGKAAPVVARQPIEREGPAAADRKAVPRPIEAEASRSPVIATSARRHDLVLPDVVMSMSEIEALRRLQALSFRVQAPPPEAQTGDASGGADPAAASPLAITEIVIAPIAIEPIEQPARLRGDVE